MSYDSMKVTLNTRNPFKYMETKSKEYINRNICPNQQLILRGFHTNQISAQFSIGPELNDQTLNLITV